MAYKCPRCGGDVQRGYSSTSQMVGGLVGALLVSAFKGFECPKCGPIPSNEFSSADRQSMMLGSVGFIVGAIAVFVGVIALLAWLNS